jgi:hypothetical protein
VHGAKIITIFGEAEQAAQKCLRALAIQTGN